MSNLLFNDACRCARRLALSCQLPVNGVGDGGAHCFGRLYFFRVLPRSHADRASRAATALKAAFPRGISSSAIVPAATTMGALRVRRPRRRGSPAVIRRLKGAKHESSAAPDPQRAECAGIAAESCVRSCISSVLLMQAMVYGAGRSFSFCCLVPCRMCRNA